jgi:RNA polymerase sigma-70 factor, ECF subfamily
MLQNKDCQHKTDEEIIGMVKNDPDFYYCLVDRYEDKIIRYIRRLTNVSPEALEDLGQEIFIKAYENIHDFDPQLKFSSWIYRIAHNHVISYWRKNQKGKEIISYDADESYANLLDSGEDLIGQLDQKIAGQKIAATLNTLKPIHKEVLVLKFLEGKDYNEISDIILKPVGTVGTLISRAKKEFRSKVTAQLR